MEFAKLSKLDNITRLQWKVCVSVSRETKMIDAKFSFNRNESERLSVQRFLRRSHRDIKQPTLRNYTKSLAPGVIEEIHELCR